MPQLVSHKAPKRYCLLSLMSIFMIGSAVWLKLILFAELWETPQHDILYERQRTECGERCHQNGRNGAPPFDVAEGLRLSVDMDACKLQHPPPPPSRRLEGLDEDEVAWALAPPSPSGSTEVFMEEWDDDRRRLDNPKGNESKKVVTPENKCRPENAQIHVNATLDHIYSPVAGLYLVLYATNHWKDPWYQANSPERDTGMFEYDPVGGNISEVHTYACVGSPGYVYMVGCLHEGFPSDDLFMKSVQPPFKDCVQIASICGATCGSGAIEPSFNDPDPTKAATFHQLKAMHCVQNEEYQPPHRNSSQSKTDDFIDTCGRPGDTFSCPGKYHQCPSDGGGHPELACGKKLGGWPRGPWQSNKAGAEWQQGVPGVVRLDDIENEFPEGLDAPAYIFSVFYILGVISLFLMYAPGVGQREGVAPSWMRLKQTIVKGTFRTGISDADLGRARATTTSRTTAFTDGRYTGDAGVAPLNGGRLNGGSWTSRS